MEDIIMKLFEMDWGNMDVKRRDLMFKKDIIYQKDYKDLIEIEKRYMNLSITERHRIIINDYIACIETANSRANDISYIAGICDALLWLHQFRLLFNSTGEDLD